MKIGIEVLADYFSILVIRTGGVHKMGVITKETFLSLIHSGGANVILTSMGMILTWKDVDAYVHPTHADRFGERSVIMEFSIDLDCCPAYCLRYDIEPVDNVDDEIFQAHFPEDASGCLSYSDIW